VRDLRCLKLGFNPLNEIMINKGVIVMFKVSYFGVQNVLKRKEGNGHG
jgi:hypothetical protein